MQRKWDTTWIADNENKHTNGPGAKITKHGLVNNYGYETSRNKSQT